MKALLLTFDVEEFDWPSERGTPIDPGEQMQVTADGVQAVLPVLTRHGVRGTFFVTGRFAEARPDVVRAVAAAGHEPAAHGLQHQDDYAGMDSADAVERLARARRMVEDAGGRPVRGLRTPRLRLCPAAVCRAAGFDYDASPHPTWVPGRYNGLRWPRVPWREGGLLRVPISVVPGLRLPVSWIWFRWAGGHAGPLAARAAALGAPYLHLYFHPWEAIPVRRYGIPAALALRTGPAFLDALDRLLAATATAMTPLTIAEFIDREHAGAPPDEPAT